MLFILLLCYKLYFDLKFEFILFCLDSEMLSFFYCIFVFIENFDCKGAL